MRNLRRSLNAYQPHRTVSIVRRLAHLLCSVSAAAYQKRPSQLWPPCPLGGFGVRRSVSRLLTYFGQRLTEIPPVHLIHEDPFAEIPAAHHMIHHARVLDAQLSRHAATLLMAVAYCQVNQTNCRLEPFPEMTFSELMLMPNEEHQR
jgi:hypothetical protein